MSSHDVPFSSQYADLGHHEWRARGCGIAALKMVMDFWSRTKTTGNRDATHAARQSRSFGDGINTAPSLDELLKAGLEAGAYREGIGWSHGGLVRLAKRYGYEGFNADYAEKGPTPKTADGAWRMLKAELEHGPVLASVYNGLDPERGGGHIVVVTGWDGQLAAVSDPAELVAREGRKLMAREPFLRAFKRRSIVIHPAGSASLPSSEPAA